MAAKRDGGEILVGLDIGTTKVAAVVGELTDNGIEVIGVGQQLCKGSRKGLALNIEQTAASIKETIHEAEQMAGCQIGSVHVGISGPHVQGIDMSGLVAVKGGEVTNDDVERVKERYKQHQWANHDAMMRAFPGVPAMLDAVAARGARMAVVTSKLEPSARRSLDFLGLSHHFEAVVGLEATERHKPDPQPLLLAASNGGLDLARTVYVGDSIHDMAAGRAAGMKTIAALWGPSEREELARAGADELAVHPADLLTIIGA